MRADLRGGVLALVAIAIGVWMISWGARLRSPPSDPFRAIGALP